MSEAAKRAVDDWKAADAQAKAVEDQLKLAWAEFHAGRGRAPSGALIAEVSRLRRLSNDKLAMAIELSHPDSRPPAPR